MREHVRFLNRRVGAGVILVCFGGCRGVIPGKTRALVTSSPHSITCQSSPVPCGHSDMEDDDVNPSAVPETVSSDRACSEEDSTVRAATLQFRDMIRKSSVDSRMDGTVHTGAFGTSVLPDWVKDLQARKSGPSALQIDTSVPEQVSSGLMQHQKSPRNKADLIRARSPGFHVMFAPFRPDAAQEHTAKARKTWNVHEPAPSDVARRCSDGGSGGLGLGGGGLTAIPMPKPLPLGTGGVFGSVLLESPPPIPSPTVFEGGVPTKLPCPSPSASEDATSGYFTKDVATTVTTPRSGVTNPGTLTINSPKRGGRSSGGQKSTVLRLNTNNDVDVNPGGQLDSRGGFTISSPPRKSKTGPSSKGASPRSTRNTYPLATTTGSTSRSKHNSRSGVATEEILDCDVAITMDMLQSSCGGVGGVGSGPQQQQRRESYTGSIMGGTTGRTSGTHPDSGNKGLESNTKLPMLRVTQYSSNKQASSKEFTFSSSGSSSGSRGARKSCVSTNSVAKSTHS